MARPRGLRLNPAALDAAIRRHPNAPISKRNIAEAAGISPGNLSELCSGKCRASLATAEAIAQAADAEVMALFPELLRDADDRPVFREAVA